MSRTDAIQHFQDMKREDRMELLRFRLDKARAELSEACLIVEAIESKKRGVRR